MIYGASDAGRNYVNVLRSYDIPVACLVDDDPQKQGQQYEGIRIFSLNDYKENRTGKETILIASYSPGVIIQKLKAENPDLYKSVKWSDFYLWENGLDYYAYYQKHMEMLQSVYGLLFDEKSKVVFENLLNYKITRDPALIKDIQDDVREQYFTSEIMRFTDKEIFMDLGAYTGDTIIHFSDSVHGTYEKIIAVEPDEENYKQLKKNTDTFTDIEYYPDGIAEKDGEARFMAQALYTSHFDEEGEQCIRTRSVDSILKGAQVTFVKADIEGLETEMLKGARATIEKYKPKLAVAVYHKKEDIFRIPLLLYNYRNDYKFFMRHYTEMPIDTVLYAV